MPGSRPNPDGGIAGVVLTGGASRRMGRTKAVLDIDGFPMASFAVTALRDVGCAPVVCLGGDATELAVLGVTVLSDRYPGQGPLGGVLGALETFEAQVDHVVVVACDLPALRADALAPLVARAATSDDVDVVVARTAAIEPACAVWSTGAAPAIRAMYRRGVRAVHEAIDGLRVDTVAVDPSALHNVNAPGDLTG